MQQENTHEESRPRAVVRTVRRLAEVVAEARSAVLDGYGLDEGRLDVLEELDATGPGGRLTAGELTQRCRVSAGAVSQRLLALEKARLIERIRERPDRRTVHVRLTTEGRARYAAVRAPVEAAESRLLDGLTAEEQVTLTSALARWLELRDVGVSTHVQG